MTTARRCQCGTDMLVRAGGVLWCSHCDDPHPAKSGPCAACRRAKQVLGIGPSSDNARP